MFLSSLEMVPPNEYWYINNLESSRTVAIGVDSGAAASVWPSGLCKEYPTVQTEQSGMHYATAGANEDFLVNEGERTLVLKMPDGTRRGTRMQVAGVRKPLMSVADMVDAGNDVYFLSSGEYYAVHRQTGTITRFVRRKNVFEIDAEVPEYSSLTSQVGVDSALVREIVLQRQQQSSTSSEGFRGPQ